MDTGLDFREENHQDRRKRWLELIKSTGVKDEEKIFDLLSHLFTLIKSARSNATYTSDQKDEQLQKRVGNVDYFDRYFVFGVPEDDISDGRIIELASQLHDDKKMVTASRSIGQLIDKDAVLCLRKLRNIQEISGVPPKPLMTILADKYLTFKSEGGFFSVPPEWAVHDMVKKAVPKIKAQERKAQFEAISANLSGLLMLIHTFMQSDERAENALEKNLRQVLVDVLKVRMSELGEKKLNDFSTDDYKLLYPYKTMVGEKELTDWLWAGVKASQWNPIDVLANLVSEATSYGSEGTRKTIGQLDSDTLENYFGLDKLLNNNIDEIKSVKPESESFLRREEPTFENKRNYVLRLLKIRHDARLQEDSNKS